MRIRIVSAAVGIPVVLLAIWSGLPGVAVLAIAAGLVGGYELDRMMRTEGAKFGGVRIVFLVAGPVALASFGTWLVSEQRISGDHFPIAVAFIFGLTLLLRGTAALGRSRNAASWVYWFFAFYIGIALSHAPGLVQFDQGRELISLAILSTFAIDSAALFVGVSIGRHRLAPSISPKKSWEGAIGGLVGGIVAVIAIDMVFETRFSLGTAGVLGAALGLTAVLGDLYESWIKRRADVKDSGTIIPGHGGILDRLDSVIPNIAVVYWFAVWISL